MSDFATFFFCKMDKIYIRFTAVIYVCIEMIAIVTRRKGVVPGNVAIGVE